MKKNIQYLMFLMLFLSSKMIFAQADTVLVPYILDGDPFGAINKFLVADTTDTGERVNPERFYKLENDRIYLLNGELHAHYHLRLIADEPESGEKPPIVVSTSGADGVIQLIQFKLFGDGYFKNIIFQATPPSGNGESNACFFLSKEAGDYVFDNVKFEWGLWTAIVTEKPVNSIKITNSYFRNQIHKTNIYNGRGIGFYQENPADSVIIQNNTIVSMNAFVFYADVSSIPPDYLLFDHNTIVNTMKFPIHSFWLPNATVTNNIFFNTHSFGEDADDKVGQDPTGLQYGIINISTIPNDLLSYYGIEEGERTYKVANNCFFYDQEIKDYWAEYELEENPFMNSRVEGMFADDATYPGLDITNTIVENPGFIQPGESLPKMIQWMQNKRNKKGNTYWGWDPDGSKFLVQWPFPEDLTYTNFEMLTAAAGGFPLGDLNWWGDDIMSDWREFLATGVTTINNSIYSNVTVMPNPASDNITLTYTLANNTKGDVSIFDINGQLIKTIFDGQQHVGLNTVNWNFKSDNTISNGIYFIQLKAGNDMVTKKFIIAK